MVGLTTIGFGVAPSAAGEDKTVICFGTPRGGTSMVAGAIYGLGVDMGDDLPVNLEDNRFNMDKTDLPRGKFVKSMQEIIRENTASKGTWGWKYPYAARYLEELLPQIKNPHLVLVFRDPVPGAMRNVSRGKMSAERAMAQRLRAEMKNLRIAEDCGAPSLMVSYERASQKPEEFLSEMAAFLNVDIPPNKDKIVEFMTPGSYKDPKSMFE